MIVTVLSPEGTSTLSFTGKSPPHVIPAALDGFEALPEGTSLVYLDIRGMGDAEREKAFKRLVRFCHRGTWGIIDREGNVADPASLWRRGAGDYLGPGFREGVLDGKRCREILSWAESLGGNLEAEGTGSEREESFPGWAALKRGEVRTFFMLYVAPENQELLRERLGETKFSDVRSRLASWLSQAFAPSTALPWMTSGAATLFLLPDDPALAGKAVEASLRYCLGEALISNERLLLDIPLPLVFALHRGTTSWEEPGSTGTVVSEDINFIYHLGAKRARSGGLTASAEAIPALPPHLAFLFADAGDFEGHPIRQSRRFL